MRDLLADLLSYTETGEEKGEANDPLISTQSLRDDKESEAGIEEAGPL